MQRFGDDAVAHERRREVAEDVIGIGGAIERRLQRVDREVHRMERVEQAGRPRHHVGAARLVSLLMAFELVVDVVELLAVDRRCGHPSIDPRRTEVGVVEGVDVAVQRVDTGGDVGRLGAHRPRGPEALARLVGGRHEAGEPVGNGRVAKGELDGASIVWIILVGEPDAEPKTHRSSSGPFADPDPQLYGGSADG